MFLCHIVIHLLQISPLIPSLVHKIDEGFELVGTVLDPCRINAVHPIWHASKS